MLQPHEIILIAHLAENQGYRLLLDAIQADADTLLDQVENARTDEEERRDMALWRAYRKIIARLKELPETFHSQLDEALTQISDKKDDNMLSLFTEDELARSGQLNDLM